jgi:hypothetical protein
MWSLMREMLRLVFLVFLSIFFLFDEEPLFDFSDWSVAQVFLFVLALCVCVWENSMRARLGQWAHKDQVLLFASLSFFWSMDNYVRAIVIIFCLHGLTPLEVELFEMVEVGSVLMVWWSSQVFPLLAYSIGALGLGIVLNMALGWGRSGLVLVLCSLIVALLSWVLFWMGWDLIFSGLSAEVGGLDQALFYIQARVGCTYDAVGGGGDQFDWHKDRGRPFVMRFEDFFVFILQLLNVISI